ncbi:MAG: hypothetical protein DCC58_18725 [Chloroflexi bacterium]|nr:MAG: hypothetical protein DCC58_18725 [Chloroflexota bacterium]
MDAWLTRWRGTAWRWWSLLAGALLAGISAALASALAMLLGRDIVSLVLLVLGLESIAIALVGAGLLERLSGRMISGGLARTHPSDTVQNGPAAGRMTDADRERRDRLTIRCALVVAPIFGTFLVLLFVS